MHKFNFFRAVIPQRDRMRYCFNIQICFLIVKKIDNCKNVFFEYDMSITESPTLKTDFEIYRQNNNTTNFETFV